MWSFGFLVCVLTTTFNEGIRNLLGTVTNLAMYIFCKLLFKNVNFLEVPPFGCNQKWVLLWKYDWASEFNFLFIWKIKVRNFCTLKYIIIFCHVCQNVCGVAKFFVLLMCVLTTSFNKPCTSCTVFYCSSFLAVLMAVLLSS